MPISLSPKTQQLIEERMKATGCSTPDELVQIALQTLEQTQGEGYGRLAPDVRDAIDEAEAQHARGDGIPLDEAFTQLRNKHLRK